jgi:hypothetical protein
MRFFLLATLLSITGNVASASELLSPRVLGLSAGYGFTCAILVSTDAAASDRQVSCWGKNASKWQGARLDGAKSLASSYNTTCALEAGNVKCWGENYFRAFSELQRPRAVSIRSRDYPCFLDDTGVRCWHEASGREPRWDTHVPALKNPTALASGDGFGCALDGGEVICWGILSNASAYTEVPALKNPKLLSASSRNMCAADDNGVKCWGVLIETTMGPIPPLFQVRELSVEDYGACAIDRDGLKCWDHPSVEKTLNFNVPKLKNPRHLVTSGTHACALADDGLHCWGRDRFGAATPPAPVFGFATKEWPYFNLDQLDSFFSVAARTSTPARAKYFADLSRLAESLAPASDRSEMATKKRVLLALLALPAMKEGDSLYASALTAVYVRNLTEFCKLLRFEYTRPESNTWRFYGDPAYAPVGYGAIRAALIVMKEFLSAPETLELGKLLRALGLASADPKNAQAKQDFRRAWVEAEPLFQKLLSNPKTAFLVVASRYAFSAEWLRYEF